jgi:hypothetical protein
VESGVETCANLITCNAQVRKLWYWNKFAFRPLPPGHNSSDKELELEFNYLPDIYPTANRSTFDLSTIVPSNDGWGGSPGNSLHSKAPGRSTFIRTGDIVKIETTDPDEFPLPNRALLDMQWILAQVAAMSGHEVDDEAWIMDEDEDEPLLFLA